METLQTKKERFARIYPARVETLIDTLRKIENCSSKSGYAWNEEIVHATWIEIGRRFSAAAKCFGVKFEIYIDGTNALADEA